MKTPAGKFEINATSDMSSVDRTSPLITFIENIVNKKSKINIKELKYFKTDEISASIKVKRPRSIPDNILFIPIISPQRGLQGFLLLTRNTKFLENDIELARHLSATYGHAYNSFLSDFVIKNFFKKNFTGIKSWIIALAIILVMIIPIRITSTAPVEVVPENPKLVTAHLMVL